MTRHVVMYSTGIGSWATAKRVIDKFGNNDVTLLFADVKGGAESEHLGEDPDNYRFLQQTADKFGAELVWLKGTESIWDTYKRVRWLGNSRLAPCSHALKQIPARKWLEENCAPDDTVVYVGIDWTESHRMEAIRRNYLPYRAEADVA